MFNTRKEPDLTHPTSQLRYHPPTADMELPWSTTDTSASSSQGQSSQLGSSSQDDHHAFNHPTQSTDSTMDDDISQFTGSAPMSPMDPRGRLIASANVTGPTSISLPTRLEDQFIDFDPQHPASSAHLHRHQHHQQHSQDMSAASYGSLNQSYGSVSAPNLLNNSTDSFDNFSTIDQVTHDMESSVRSASAAGSAASSLHSGHQTENSPASKKSSIGPHRQKSRHKCDRHQFEELLAFFATNRNPTGKVRQDLAKRLDMPERSVQIWFQNR